MVIIYKGLMVFIIIIKLNTFKYYLVLGFIKNLARVLKVNFQKN